MCLIPPNLKSEDADNFTAQLYNYLDTHPIKYAEWMEVKEQSRKRITEKRAETPRRNLNLRVPSTVQNARKKTEKKRGIGRPPIQCL
jgi:hypothetical protein